ncbi:hypothetical protein [Paenibacillus sp. NPDC058071]|uniref:hypothetical protein n=1 Tax=Paenibacillus sp. NPDC058071 TaxID=3346326 RepID=UPI0036DCA403
MMRFARKKWIVAAAGLTLAAAIVLLTVGLDKKLDLFNFLSGFTVVVDNQSDVDLLSLETGLIAGASDGNITEGESRDHHEGVQSGRKIKIKPNLQLSGEGAVYLKWTDAEGNSTIRAVCSYTEYLSGHAKVIVKNGEATVEQKCY